MAKFQEKHKSPGSNRSIHDVRPVSTAIGTRETAQYIADLLLELRNLAKGQGLLTVQGLLEVAYYEAFAASMEIKLPEGELERLQEMSRASGLGK